MSDLPDELVPLSWLIGRWAGVGLGQYPTIEDFRFGQEVSFTTDGRPFLAYHSRAWLLDDAGEKVRPLAMESGFWRARPDNQIEVTLAHASGYAELWLGSVEVLGIENARITGARATLRTDVITASPSAKQYDAGERLYGLVNDELMWTFDMAAVGEGMGNHLSARLKPAD
ncbi:MAG: FABP family protein [Candidatus Nanopelagicales bacterium]